MTDVSTVTVAKRRGPKRDVPMSGRKDKSLPGPNMELEVRNFGPIAKGKIDLRPLTVFVGPSNTGKSWMAMLAYSLASALSAKSSAKTLATAGLLLWENTLQDIFADSPTIDYPEDRGAWHGALTARGKVTLTTEETKLACRAAELSKSEFLGEMVRCFGLEVPKQLIRWNTNGKAKISVKFDTVRYNMEIGESLDSTSLKARIEKNPTLNFSKDSTTINSGERERYLDQMLYSMQGWLSSDEEKILSDPINSMSATLGLLHCSRNFENAFYIPAVRGGIMHAYDVIVDGAMDIIGRSRPEGSSSRSLLTGIVSDFNRCLNRIGTMTKRRHDKSTGLEGGLEANVLRGTVDMEPVAIGHPRVYYQPVGSDVRLPIDNTSSMISEIAPVALYLKYLVRAGDLLIFEEPEMNMHPDLQRQMVREIVRWVNAGIRVIISTHSDWVLNEVSNTVARCKLEEKLPGRCDAPHLDEHSIGVWQFDYVNNEQYDSGTKIRSIDWNPYHGGYDAGFLDVVKTQNNDWATTMNMIGWEDDET